MPCRCHLLGKHIVELPNGLYPKILAGLTDNEVREILSAATHRRVRAHTVIINDGDPAERFHMLTSGKAIQYTVHKDQHVPVRWLLGGSPFGSPALAKTEQERRYIASTEMTTDGCIVSWDRETFGMLAERFPRVVSNILGITIGYISWLSERGASIVADDAHTRVARLLKAMALEIGEVTDDGSGTEILANNDDIARAAGVTPATLSRIIREWRESGAVIKGRGKITLVCPRLVDKA